MGRRKTIDREVLLDAAEQIVTTQGASALTIDALAKAVGITKGGVQYNFSTKDVLIDAMFERWGMNYDEQFREIAGDAPEPLITVQAHIEATMRSDEASTAKAAGLLAGLLQTPEHLESTRTWYRQRIEGLDTTTEEGRRARLAFLATEGAFVLRFFGLMDIGEDEWRDIFGDILASMPFRNSSATEQQK
ncbi:TetR/AcrR family transcriptional regulator [Xenorhabdus hominickii]|uniref:TetR family transcriptional regulator n=1 Tax=Xenorhabdus hominickii TaxID=351679 RepID=A0A2G0QFC1_XENHO|nr:TetR family transcriptional regulator [Xenorhabdus hominickii]AOM41922.1 TetR family transcriptional regulator [Xenorhabdus hominickii]PHM57901.1 TetR family transcriptional regulator [Xenorhabdus hominickii]